MEKMIIYTHNSEILIVANADNFKFEMYFNLI